MNAININATGIRPSVIEEIRAIAERLLVERVILFGSRARGDFEQTSDIDLAVFGGDATGSPKMILKTAYQAGMIRDEELWLHALQERNNIAHSYNENVALGIVRQTREKFLAMFGKLKADLEESWM